MKKNKYYSDECQNQSKCKNTFYKLLENIKWWLIFWFSALFIVILWLSVYALVNDVWTTPDELEAHSWSVLTSEAWNKILSNQNALSGAIVNLSATQTFVAPANAIVAFYLETCPSGWNPADWSNSTPDLRWTFIRWLNWNKNWRDISRNLWDYQEDTFQWFATLTENNMHYGGRWWQYLTALSSGNQKYWREYSFPVSNPDVNYWTPRISNETRPKNIALIYCMKE
jgi:hypothetical protein